MDCKGGMNVAGKSKIAFRGRSQIPFIALTLIGVNLCR